MTNDTNIKVVTVTPELAEQWLTKNTHNRNLRQAHVRGLSQDMRDGAWTWNGESIKFAKDGTLLDGQHRLAAIVESGVTIEILVITEVDGDTQHTMDTGSKRTASDMLKLRGEKNYNTLASGIRACILWDSGSRNMTGTGSGKTITNPQILRYLDEHPESREYATQFVLLRSHVPMPASIGMLAIRLFHEIDTEDATYFFDRLASDEGHYRGQPIHALRGILLQPKHESRISYTPNYKLAVMIKAWNKFRAGEDVGLLRFKPGGANPEAFPEPK